VRLLTRFDRDLFDFERRFSVENWQASLQQPIPISGFMQRYKNGEWKQR